MIAETKKIKFVCGSSALKKALDFCAPAIQVNPIVPIFTNALLLIENGVMTVTGSDYKLTLSTTINVESMSDVSICLPHKLLSSLLGSIPEQPVTITIHPDTFGASLKTSSGTYKLSGENAADYSLPKPGKETVRKIELDQDEAALFTSSFSRLLFAVCKDDLRPAMTGVCWDGTEIVATDGHRIARVSNVPGGGAQFIIPDKAAHVLVGTAQAQKKAIGVEITSRAVTFRIGACVIHSPLIDERFPDYKNAFPVHNPINWVCNRKELIAALSRVMLVASATTSRIRLVGDTAGTIGIFAEELDMAQEGEEIVPGDVSEGLVINFNAKFLLECLRNLTGDDVTLALSAPNRGAILTGGDPDAMMLLMPIM